MKKFSNIYENKVLNFHDLIDPKISFDFLLGLYLSVFRRDKWIKNLGVVNKKNLLKPEHFLLLKIHVLMSRSFQKLLLNQKLIFVLRD